MADLMVFERLEEITGDDRDLAVEIAGLFAETAKGYVEQLDSAYRNGQEEWSAAAHALKGCCGNFGAEALADLAKACEKEAPSLDRIDELTRLLADTTARLSDRYGLCLT